MPPNQSVIKSKSSNTAIRPKPSKSNKKSRSNGEFMPNSSKKRGVYVEKKSKLTIHQEDSRKNGPKPPTRREHKRFVASVLSLLSKCSTSTQYPDDQSKMDPTQPKRIKKILEQYQQSEEDKYKNKIRSSISTETNTPHHKDNETEERDKFYIQTTSGTVQTSKGAVQATSAQARVHTTSGTVQTSKGAVMSRTDNEIKIKKDKYRSKALRNNNDESLVILKRNREFSAHHSEPSSRASNSTRGRRVRTYSPKRARSPLKQNASKFIAENSGLRTKKEKEDFDDYVEESVADPDTLVSKIKPPEVKPAKEMYSFFLDLLESTIQGTNVVNPVSKLNLSIKAPPVVVQPVSVHQVDMSKLSVSKTHFEIDADVAQKLDIPKEEKLNVPDEEPATYDINEVTECKGKINNDANYNVADDIYDYVDDPHTEVFSTRGRVSRWSEQNAPRARNKTRTRFRSPTSSYWSPHRATLRRQITSPDRSWDWMHSSQKSNTCSLKSHSFALPNKPSSKKRFKQNFIKMLKEQLQMDDYIYEEPENLYDVLKTMAMNKRRCRKAIQFDRKALRTADGRSFDECWKRRKVISSAGRARRKPYFEERDNMKSFNTSSILRSSTACSTVCTSRSSKRSCPRTITSNMSTVTTAETNDNTLTDSDISLEVRAYFDIEPKRNRNERSNVYYAASNSSGLTYNGKRLKSKVYESLSKIVLGLNKGIL